MAFIVDQACDAGDVYAKPMFGEYGIYCRGRMVAMACDDRLFVKPTAGGRSIAPGAEEMSPYPGAKPCLVIDAERLNDGEWLTKLFRITAAEMPLPKPKSSRSRRASGA